jgi:hypothetical protein
MRRKRENLSNTLFSDTPSLFLFFSYDERPRFTPINERGKLIVLKRLQVLRFIERRRRDEVTMSRERNKTPYSASIWGSGGIDPRILNLHTIWRCVVSRRREDKILNMYVHFNQRTYSRSFQ